MVLILYGNSEICAHVRSNLFYLICISHFLSSRAVTNRIVLPQKKFVFSFIRAQHVLSYHLISIDRLKNGHEMWEISDRQHFLISDLFHIQTYEIELSVKL